MKMKQHTLQVVGDNLQRVLDQYEMTPQDCADHERGKDIDAAEVMGILNGDPDMKLWSVYKVCDLLLIDPGTIIRPKVPLTVLMSRRLPRLTEKYCGLTHEKREEIEVLVDARLRSEA